LNVIYSSLGSCGDLSLSSVFCKFGRMCLKKKKSKVNYLNFHIRKLEKAEKIKSKASRIKEMIKIRAEINDIENRKSIEINQLNKKMALLKF
jgi:ERCC4-type nuclease